jgi:hypothetical protein
LWEPWCSSSSRLCFCVNCHLSLVSKAFLTASAILSLFLVCETHGHHCRFSSSPASLQHHRRSTTFAEGVERWNRFWATDPATVTATASATRPLDPPITTAAVDARDSTPLILERGAALILVDQGTVPRLHAIHRGGITTNKHSFLRAATTIFHHRY